jgi:hypothetical protein
MSIGRLTARLGLAVAFLAALAVPATAFPMRGIDKPETWTVAAAALAVITSVISSWSSRRVVELQEDAQRPNPILPFDLNSRHGLALVRVTNKGATPAHDISVEWTTELTNQHGKPIGFGRKENSSAISVLLPGESISQIIGDHVDFITAHPATNYVGRITFRDTKGRPSMRRFRLDGRPYAGTPAYDSERDRMH